MEFLGVGYQEVLVILALLLVVVGPERLPGVAYQVGRAVRTLQQYARAVRDEFSDEIGYVEEQYRIVKDETGALNESIRAGRNDLDLQLPETLTSEGHSCGDEARRGRNSRARGGPVKDRPRDRSPHLLVGEW